MTTLMVDDFMACHDEVRGGMEQPAISDCVGERRLGGVRAAYTLAIAQMIEFPDFRRPQFRSTAAYGHFGREGEGIRRE